MIMLALCAVLAQVAPSHPSKVETQLVRAVLPGVGEVWMELKPFSAIDAALRVEFGGAATRFGASEPGEAVAAKTDAIVSAARTVITRSGQVSGHPGSRAYIAQSPRGQLGIIELGGRRFAMAPDEGTWSGPIRGAVRWVESPGSGAPLIDEMCRMLPGHHDQDANEGGVAGDPTHIVRGLRVRVAADCDYEFTSIFADAEDCAAYVVSLYGAISSIYEREMGVRVQLSYLRLWQTPDDPFNSPDPLYEFRDHWNATQQEVVRDVAQLLSGRRNLPYGGVAWLNAACGSFGYSVNGYLIGSFADPGRTDPGNWDVIVCAHELGHNIGTLHTHDYAIDTCASGTILRGGFMSYCHTVSGATANVDMTMHRLIRAAVADFMVNAPCLGSDCDGDGVEDAEAIVQGQVVDLNGDGIPDACQDCNDDGVLDPDEIAMGAMDADDDGVPDACQPDCNGNGIVDVLDVLNGSSGDLWGNLVPDECETDCNGNGTSDYNEILANMALDLDRDGRIDACQDCDGDGVLDAQVLGSSRFWWLASNADGALRELHPRSGVRTRTSAPAPAAVYDLALTGNGMILGTSGSTVGRWDPNSGAFLGALVQAPNNAGLSGARGLLVMPDESLLVASSGSTAVLKFTAAGAPAGVFVQFPGGLGPRPNGLARRSDGVIAVSYDDGLVRGYAWPNGAPVGVLADLAAVGPNSDPAGLLYLPSGDLLVASRGLSSIQRFDGTTGSYEGRFDVGPSSNSAIAMKKPTAMRLIAGGKVVLVTDSQSGAPVVGLDAESGYHLRTYRVYPTDAPSATGLLVMPSSPLDCNGNLLPDSCDLAAGTSEDRNGDAIPDECQGGPWAPEDLNFDGAVNGADLALVLGNWSFSGTGDLNGDGTVDGVDLALVLGAWTG